MITIEKNQLNQDQGCYIVESAENMTKRNQVGDQLCVIDVKDNGCYERKVVQVDSEMIR